MRELLVLCLLGENKRVMRVERRWECGLGVMVLRGLRAFGFFTSCRYLDAIHIDDGLQI